MAAFNRMVRSDTVFLTAPHEVLHAKTIPLTADIRVPVMVFAELQFHPDIRDGAVVVIITKDAIFINTRNCIRCLNIVSSTIFSSLQLLRHNKIT